MGWLMSQHVKPLAEELGMQRIHWHALRHLNNSLMMNEGVDVATRMDRLGHVTDRVNLIYSHSGDEAQMAASEAIERRLEAARDTLEKRRQAGFQALSPLLTVTQTVTPNRSREATHWKHGRPGEIRTPDPRFRKPLLYPSELQARPIRLASQPTYLSTLVRSFRALQFEPPGNKTA